MSDFNQNINKDSNLKEAPIPVNKCCFSCPECQSSIRLLSINEENNVIEFECLNKRSHGKKVMVIK